MMTAELVQAMFELQDASIAPERAAAVAATLQAQLATANKAFAKLPFEAEPAAYLSARNEAAR